MRCLIKREATQDCVQPVWEIAESAISEAREKKRTVKPHIVLERSVQLPKSANIKARRFRLRARNGGADQGTTCSQKDTQSELLWVSGLDGFNPGIANTAARVHQLTRIIAK